MKPSAIALTGVAIFAGVLGALQVDRALSHRKGSSDQELFGSSSSVGVTGIPASYDIAAPSFDFRSAAKKVNPSVVSVDRYQKVQRGMFDEEVQTVETGTGSGVVISENGTIVTNNHVVEGATEVKVRFSDKDSRVAKVIGTDPRSDLAVLKVEGKKVTPIELGDSKSVEVGEWVMAVGNPLGFDNTVSVGVVSSLKRNLPVGTQGLVDGIQTDAAINPGNSGGALCDAQGRLIGINSAIASRTGQSVGIGFAIPVDRVKKVANEIVKYGKARYPSLGITYRGDLERALGDPYFRQDLAQRVGSEDIPNSGVIVWDSTGQAAKAGIQRLSIITELDGQKVEGTFDMNRVLIPKKPGDKVNVKFWDHGTMKTADVTLQEIAAN